MSSFLLSVIELNTLQSRRFSYLHKKGVCVTVRYHVLLRTCITKISIIEFDGGLSTRTARVARINVVYLFSSRYGLRKKTENLALIQSHRLFNKIGRKRIGFYYLREQRFGCAKRTLCFVPAALYHNKTCTQWCDKRSSVCDDETILFSTMFVF